MHGHGRFDHQYAYSMDSWIKITQFLFIFIQLSVSDSIVQKYVVLSKIKNDKNGEN